MPLITLSQVAIGFSGYEKAAHRIKDRYGLAYNKISIAKSVFYRIRLPANGKQNSRRALYNSQTGNTTIKQSTDFSSIEKKKIRFHPEIAKFHIRTSFRFAKRLLQEKGFLIFIDRNWNKSAAK